MKPGGQFIALEGVFEADGDIYVSGSGTLVRGMLADGGPATKLSLAGSETYRNGVVHLAYSPVA
jgi:hypothetical protein